MAKFIKKITITIFLLLFLNFSFFSFTYYHHHPSSLYSFPFPHHPLLLNLPHNTFQIILSTSSKPWPSLPSHLPWHPPSNSIFSCEGFFGNGFSKTSTLYSRPNSNSKSNNSWFECHCSETLRSSICEGGWVLMDPNKIQMSNGGERIEEVIGRSDDDELPNFEKGAFRLRRKGVGKKNAFSKEFIDEFVHQGEISKHTMRELFQSMEVVDDENDFHCSKWIDEPTLLLTRFEYANVFHTYTDWYSAYVSSRVTGLPTRPNVVFVDGHSKTQLEETWEALFSSIRFAKNFTGPVCFRHAVFAPLGYETPWFKGLNQHIDCQGASATALWVKPDDHKTARLSEFGEMIKAAFDFPVKTTRNSKSSEYNVLFVRREDYLAHPRHGGKVESRLSNEQEVFDSLKAWASNYSKCNINVINGLFGHLPMREQIRAIEDASVIIGAHGAGLTHVVSALPETVILEIISSQFRRPHFQLISQWKGLEYHAINLPGSSANPTTVIERLKRIMRSIGC
ncbi:beta-1,2-xylosyltransferase-like [Amaranthus tricolor]|uniref:beta-1,2-xylosyltransferase-like n=1 Tax=Amaranthus tricolor TaxID=29722 RepID=UPI00258B398B|nr:beta-1,2-xylosyltransferase-like [Amaranthus tricolor]